MAGPFPLVLASASPRRRALMRWVGVPFRVCPPPEMETFPPSPPWEETTLRWAEAKARWGQERFPQHIILGADTLVVVEEEALGKPQSPEEALAMLRRLQGRWHRVITGFVLLWEERCFREAVSTEVFFRAAGEEELRAYVATGEPMDKAGAYAVQGHGAVFIEAVRGDFFNVIGLPVARVYACLRAWGFERRWEGRLSW